MKISMFRTLCAIVLGLFIFSLTGCALSPKNQAARIASDELLVQQLDEVERYLKQTPNGQRTVVYVGSAQHSQSLVFQRDVLLVKKELLAVNPSTQSIALSNEPQTSKLTYPFATLHTLTQTFDRIAEWSKKYSITLVLLISTHGNVDMLTSNVANEYYTPIQSKHLRHWLNRLGDTPTAIILSACYSGSFIPVLEASNRLIFTSAAMNRISFGCAYHDDNTYFIGELFGPNFMPEKTWNENFKMAKFEIEKKEKYMGVKQSSNPQSSIPDIFSKISINEFLKP
jgi:hypothetical protein